MLRKEVRGERDPKAGQGARGSASCHSGASRPSILTQHCALGLAELLAGEEREYRCVVVWSRYR